MDVENWLFVAAATFLIVHEMDAVDKKEWRLLFGFRRHPDTAAYPWFLLLHLPLLAALLALVAASGTNLMRWAVAAVDLFIVGHAGLHERLNLRGDTAFANPVSRVLIWGGAAFAAVDLAVRLGSSS